MLIGYNIVNMKEKNYYSIAELAQILGISRIAVYKRIKSGKIEAHKIGRMFVIPKSEIESILGTVLTEDEKKVIDSGVKRAVREYGETLKKLGSE